ncbi:NUDIX domain-containing protein (plasmid) [Streptomyces sp. LZ34]
MTAETVETETPVETEDWETISYTVDIVCIRGADVLLIVRGDAPYEGKLALPGGGVNRGEFGRVAAAREFLEEAGVVVDPDALVLVGVYDQPDRDPRGRVVTAAYRVDLPSDATVVAKEGDDAAAVQWVPLDTVLTDLADDLAFDHHAILADAWRQRQVAAELEQLRSIYREVWLHVVDAGSMLLTHRVEKALTGDTSLSDESRLQGWIHGEHKLPDHVRHHFVDLTA